MLIFVRMPAAIAGFDESERWYRALDEETRYVVQANLVLLGLYDRFIDGEFGPGTFNAIRAFDSRGGSNDGVLSKRQMDQLQTAAAKVFNEHGYEPIRDDAGLRVYVPLKLLTTSRASDRGTRYSAGDSSMVLETVRKPLTEQGFNELYAQMSSRKSNRSVSYATLRDGVFTVSGVDGGKIFYARFFNNGSASVGYSFSWTDDVAELGQMVSIMLANFSFPIGSDEGKPSEPPAKEKDAEPSSGSGTGFFVSDKGLIVTNYHVAGECRTIDVPPYGKAKLVKADKGVDLAAIELEKDISSSFATVRIDKPTLGESVVMVGYPLAQLLDSSINIATGIVSSETGLGGETKWFTTNAGVQPGNSGGPILDTHGNVVGVAVAKIDDAKLLAAIGNVAPNVGFAIKNNVLLDFLDIFKHSRSERVDGADLGVQEIARRARAFTVQIICDM
jgi:S1-C subfamily serine protease